MPQEPQSSRLCGLAREVLRLQAEGRWPSAAPAGAGGDAGGAAHNPSHEPDVDLDDEAAYQALAAAIDMVGNMDSWVIV